MVDALIGGFTSNGWLYGTICNNQYADPLVENPIFHAIKTYVEVLLLY